MSTHYHRLIEFFKELRRRKVIQVITVYAAASFIILELVDILAPSLSLPEWTLNLVLLLLCVGFVIAVIVSWIYDIHPEGGIVKTEPAHKVKSEDIPKSSNGWKIASYISFMVIVGLIVLNLIPRSGNKEILDKSIAVLPFRNDSPDQERMYFINGTMEAILDNLCKIEDLRVPGRISVEQYRDNPKPIPVVAEEMNVSYVLEGSGHRDGNNVRLFVQLLDGKNDKHIWSKSYDADIEEIFSMQSEIAQMIASEIRAVITPEEKQLIEMIPTTNLTAYDFYQRGNEESAINRGRLASQGYEIDNETRAALERAEVQYQKALELDSTFAQAYIGLAEIYMNKRYWETIFEEDFLDSVQILANKALSFDSKLSDAYAIRGYYYNQIGEPDKAVEDIDRAVEFNPNNGMAYIFGGEIYIHRDFIKSLQYVHIALSLNRGDQLPTMLYTLGWVYLGAGFIEKSKYYYSETFKLTRDSLSYYNGLAICEYVSGNFSDAIEFLNKIFALDSTDHNIHSAFGEYYMMNGDYVQALKHYKKWLEGSQSMSQGAVYGMHRVGWAYWMNGMKEEGEAFFRRQIDHCNRMLELDRNINNTFRNYYDLAATYAFIGEKDKAYDNLRNYTKYPMYNSWMLHYISNDPLFDSIRDEPEFQQIVRGVEAKYQAEHERVKQWLEENDMLCSCERLTQETILNLT